MEKNEYKDWKKTLKDVKSRVKDAKKAYKAERLPLMERIKIIYNKVVEQVHYYVKVAKIIYKSVFHAWIRIQDLKKENNKIQDEIKSVIEATERHDAPVDFTINRLKNLLL